MRRILLSLAFVFCATALFAQVENAQVNGSFQIDGQYYKVDEAIGNFGGFPSITLPIGLDDNFPFGGNLTCKPYDEVTCLNVAYALENKLGLKNITAKGGQN